MSPSQTPFNKFTPYDSGKAFEIITMLFGIISIGNVAPDRKSIGKYTRYDIILEVLLFGEILAINSPIENILSVVIIKARKTERTCPKN